MNQTFSSFLYQQQRAVSVVLIADRKKCRLRLTYILELILIVLFPRFLLAFFISSDPLVLYGLCAHMILWSPLCSNTFQLRRAMSAHGTWTASGWFCLQAQAASTSGEGTAIHTFSSTLVSMGGRLRSPAEMRTAAWSNMYWPRHPGSHVPRGEASSLIMKSMEKRTIHVSVLVNVNQKQK